MSKDNAIVIRNPQDGVSPSAILGIQEIRNLNITDKPGVAYPNFAPAKESSTTVTDLITDVAHDTDGNALWGISDSKLYKRISSGVWSSISLPGGGSSGTHYGINIWKGYLFLFAGYHLDVLDLSDETTWTKGWKNLGGSTGKRPSISGQDDILYFGLGTYGLGSLKEILTKTFDPSDSSTYSLKSSGDTALDIPSGFYIWTLGELGNKLLVCAGRGNYEANIYPWDRSSQSFDKPLKFYEDGDNAGWQIITLGNLTYVHIGNKGQWYVTDGVTARPFSKIPETMKASGTNILNHKAIAYINGKIHFGIGGDASGDENLGVYSLNPNTGQFVIEHTLSTSKSDATVYIGFIHNFGNGNYINSFQSDTSFGVDEVTNSSSRYINDSAYIISQYYNVGTRLNKKTFKYVDINLIKDLIAGDSVKIYERSSINGTWNLIKAWTTIDKQHLHKPFTKSMRNVQFKIVLNGEAELLEALIV